MFMLHVLIHSWYINFDIFRKIQNSILSSLLWLLRIKPESKRPKERNLFRRKGAVSSQRTLCYRMANRRPQTLDNACLNAETCRRFTIAWESCVANIQEENKKIAQHRGALALLKERANQRKKNNVVF